MSESTKQNLSMTLSTTAQNAQEATITFDGKLSSIDYLSKESERSIFLHVQLYADNLQDTVNVTRMRFHGVISEQVFRNTSCGNPDLLRYEL